MGGAEVLDLARTAIWVTIKIAAPVMLARAHPHGAWIEWLV